MQTRTFSLQGCYTVMFGEQTVMEVLMFFVRTITTLNRKLTHFLKNFSDLQE